MFDASRLHDSAHDADPTGVWEELRNDHPVFYDEIARVYFVTRHSDVRRAFTEQDTFSSRIYRKTMGRVFGPMLLQMEGRDHVKRRTIVAGVLAAVCLAGGALGFARALTLHISRGDGEGRFRCRGAQSCQHPHGRPRADTAP